MIEVFAYPPRNLSASVPVRSRDDPKKNKGPVTEVAEPLQFPVSVRSTAGNATLYAPQGNMRSNICSSSSNENSMLI